MKPSQLNKLPKKAAKERKELAKANARERRGNERAEQRRSKFVDLQLRSDAIHERASEASQLHRHLKRPDSGLWPASDLYVVLSEGSKVDGTADWVIGSVRPTDQDDICTMQYAFQAYAGTQGDANRIRNGADPQFMGAPTREETTIGATTESWGNLVRHATMHAAEQWSSKRAFNPLGGLVRAVSLVKWDRRLTSLEQTADIFDVAIHDPVLNQQLVEPLQAQAHQASQITAAQ
jgi:hypothetical protein